MHTTLSFIAAASTTVANNKKSTGGSFGILIIIALFAAAYFLLIRPRQQKLRQQQAAARQMEVGDDVVTAGGIHGRLVGLGDDTAEVEVAPGVVMTFLRRAVNARPAPASPAPQAEQHEEEDDWAKGTPASGAGSSFEAGDADHLGPPPQAGDHDPGETAGPAS